MQDFFHEQYATWDDPRIFCWECPIPITHGSSHREDAVMRIEIDVSHEQRVTWWKSTGGVVLEKVLAGM